MANHAVDASSPPYPDQSYPQTDFPQQSKKYPQAYYPPPQYPPSAQPYPQQPYPGHVAYVGQPNSGYSTPSSQGHQQQQQRVIMSTISVVPVSTLYVPSRSYIPHIVVAAISILFCWIFGAVALYQAVVARNTLGDPQKAKRLGCSSLGFSITGILIGAGVVIGIAVNLSTSYSSSNCHRGYNNYYNCH